MLSLVILYNSISSPAELHVYSISYWFFIIPLPLTCNCCFFTWRFCRYGWNIQATISYSILNVNWIVFFFFLFCSTAHSNGFFRHHFDVTDSFSPPAVLFICYTWIISQPWISQSTKHGEEPQHKHCNWPAMFITKNFQTKND